MLLRFNVGEGFGGALYWQDFIKLAQETGFTMPRLVRARLLKCENKRIRDIVGQYEGNLYIHYISA